MEAGTRSAIVEFLRAADDNNAIEAERAKTRPVAEAAAQHLLGSLGGQPDVRKALIQYAIYLAADNPERFDAEASAAYKLLGVELVAMLWADHDKRQPARPNGKRPRRTKRETSLGVSAAILHKINNPEASPAECAKAGSDLPRTTLEGNPEWQRWKDKIEAANNDGRMNSVRVEFDRRTQEHLAYEVEDETDEGDDFT